MKRVLSTHPHREIGRGGEAAIGAERQQPCLRFVAAAARARQTTDADS